MELLIGCGSNRQKKIMLTPEDTEWRGGLVTLDHNPHHRPDVVHDLMSLPLPFHDATFDSIHAYHVMEHLGAQGDWRWFFRQFDEFARILTIGGHFYAICPSYKSLWAWGDPSHTRILNSATLAFLMRKEYDTQVGKTNMSDFRSCFTSDWEVAACSEDDHNFVFVLKLRSKGNVYGTE